MKILHINCVYNTGSTGKIVYDVHRELLSRGFDSVVYYGRGEKTNEPNVYKTCGELYSKFNNLRSRITGVMYGGCFFSTNRIISMIKKENPDIVHLQCINGYFVNIYRLLEFLKRSKIKTVLTLHAEFMHTANCGYALDCDKWKTGCGKCPRLKKETKSFFVDGTHTSWERMQRAFKGFDNLTLTSVSPWLMQRAKMSPFLADIPHYVVMNGLDTDIFHVYDTEELKKQHGISDGQKVIFHATPFFTDNISHIKGGRYILKLARMLPDVRFIVAGNYEENLDIPENLTLLGRLSNQTTLAQYYSMADITVLASEKETFSMICAESLSCGTPMVGFKAGAPEQISLPEYSRFVEYANINALCEAATEMLEKSIPKQAVCESAHRKYARTQMTNGYIDIYSKINGATR